MKKPILIVLACIMLSNSVCIDSNKDQPCRDELKTDYSVLGTPFAIVDKLIDKEVPLFPEFNQPTEKNNRNDRSQNKYYIFKNTEVETRLVCKSEKCADEGFLAIIQGVSKSCTSPPKFQVTHKERIHLFMLVYFVLLRRSNLPGEVNNPSIKKPNYVSA